MFSRIYHNSNNQKSHILLRLHDSTDRGGILKRFVKACMLTSLVFVLFLNGIIAQDMPSNYPSESPCSFGTVVHIGDPDVGLSLDAFSWHADQLPLDLGYWDIGPVPRMYDEGDVVYLHIGGAVSCSDTHIASNDIRLTPFGNYEAGSKVAATDNDIGQILNTLPDYYGIYFMDLHGISDQYDAGDTAYFKVRTNPYRTQTNDIRVTPIPTKGLLAGTKVKNFDEDHDKPIIQMVCFPVMSDPWWPVANIRFYNVNGNVNAVGAPVYDQPDIVYVDVPGPRIAGEVSPGDIRLTPCF
jgi:hypothetical protein